MRERLLSGAVAVARIVLVILGFVVALGSIGVATVRGFCPGGEDAAAVVVAAPADPGLATIVDEEGPAAGTGDQTGPTAEPVDPADGATEQEVPAEGGACAGGVSRCLPPLVSSILILGDGECHEEAGGRLRGILVPAFVGSTILFAGAWAVRPSQLHAWLGTSTPTSGRGGWRG